jgi:hypothetical protein
MRLFAVTAVLASAASSVLGVSLYLVGDSTMASHKASEGIEGYVKQVLIRPSNLTRLVL